VTIYSEKIIPGEGKGRAIGFPTLNLVGKEISQLENGIYCIEVFGLEKADKNILAALFVGKTRLHDKDKKTFEVHVIDKDLTRDPEYLKFKVLGKVSRVEEFSSKEELKDKIKRDLDLCRRFYLS